jgi:hypothetical protein
MMLAGAKPVLVMRVASRSLSSRYKKINLFYHFLSSLYHEIYTKTNDKQGRLIYYIDNGALLSGTQNTAWPRQNRQRG